MRIALHDSSAQHVPSPKVRVPLDSHVLLAMGLRNIQPPSLGSYRYGGEVGSQEAHSLE